MSTELEREARRVADDTSSGASELLDRAIGILERARVADATTLRHVVRALCLSQPCMAPIWNAAALALSPTAEPGALEEFGRRSARDIEIVARHAYALLTLRVPLAPGALHVTTCSASGTVRAALTRLRSAGSVVVACAEGRPLYEGRRLATRLASDGLNVHVYTDAAISAVLPATTAVVVGADAVGPNSFVNKCGTRQLAGVAAASGVPVYLLAGRDKFVPACLDDRLALRAGAAVEVWARPTARVTVQNPYFERVPLDVLTGLVTPMGVLPPEAIPSIGPIARPSAAALALAASLAADRS